MEGVTEQVVFVDSFSLFFFIKKRKRSSLYKYTRTRFGVVGYGRLNRLIKSKRKKDLFPQLVTLSLYLSLSFCPVLVSLLFLVLALVNDPLAGRNSELPPAVHLPRGNTAA